RSEWVSPLRPFCLLYVTDAADDTSEPIAIRGPTLTADDAALTIRDHGHITRAAGSGERAHHVGRRAILSVVLDGAGHASELAGIITIQPDTPLQAVNLVVLDAVFHIRSICRETGNREESLGQLFAVVDRGGQEASDLIAILFKQRLCHGSSLGLLLAGTTSVVATILLIVIVGALAVVVLVVLHDRFPFVR